MAEYKINQATLYSVRGKVVVLTGGAQGIGAATVTQLYHSSAHVVFCDWDDKAGSSLVEHLKSSVQSDGSVVDMKVDVRDYQALWSMFDATYTKHGRIDMAICCAGVTERQGYFEPDKLNLESAKEIPTGLADVLAINLKGTLYFARLAVAYLKENHTFDSHATGDELSSPKCITFVSSVAGFISERYTTVQRSQHLTQADPRVFGESYVANCSSVDGQGAFRGEESDRRHIEYFQSMEKFHEEGLPDKLPAHLEDNVHRDLQLCELEKEVPTLALNL